MQKEEKEKKKKKKKKEGEEEDLKEYMVQKQNTQERSFQPQILI